MLPAKNAAFVGCLAGLATAFDAFLLANIGATLGSCRHLIAKTDLTPDVTHAIDLAPNEIDSMRAQTRVTTWRLRVLGRGELKIHVAVCGICASLYHATGYID